MPHASNAARLARLIDLIITGGIVLLIVFTPLAIGSVLPWAFGAAEAIVFVMVALWMVKLLLVEPAARMLPNPRGLFAPLALFAALGLVQLMPLPPAITRAISPATYRLYAKVLSGWPAQPPYRDLLSAPPFGGSADMVRVLPTEDEVREGASVPRVGFARRGAQLANAGRIAAGGRWRPLSIAPPLTRTILLQFLAFSGLFFLILFYPFDSPTRGATEKRFYRVVLGAVLATAMLVACIAILERAWWNGKILWLFSPYDWAGLKPDLAAIRRARGPFVDPDHFGSYLNLVLPLALAAMFFRTFIASHRQRAALRVTSAVIAFVMVVGLLLSLSRAGWIGALVGVFALVWMCGYLRPERRPPLFNLSRKATAALVVAGLVAIVASSSLFVGGSGATDVSARLHETLGDNPTLQARLQIWRDSLPMLRDFPVFGVGLGCFQDLIAHYQRPPWPAQSINAAHNDYLELVLDAGLIGIALLGWFFIGAARRGYRGMRRLPSDRLPVAAALMAGIAAMAFQELFDFNLQIPANALLFTLILALALRLIGSAGGSAEIDSYGGGRPYAFASMVSVIAVALAIASMCQGTVPYPYNLKRPSTVLGARRMVLSHPTLPTTHAWMVDALGDRLSPRERARELGVAVWLDPTNPYFRDAYAQSLAWDKQRAKAMAELTESVYSSPWFSTHPYLRARLIPWLSEDERAAVEKGFRMAAARHFKGAIWGLGDFFEMLHQYAKEGDFFRHAAADERSQPARADLLVKAGLAYSQADEMKKARDALEEAVALDPANPKPYEYLAARVFAASKDLKSARAAVERGLDNNGDPVELYQALADASEACGDIDGAEIALEKAAQLQPANFELIWRLASFYMRQSRFDQAGLWMRRATEIRPESADAFYQLGLADEAAYHYFDASRDFQEAIRRAPENVEIRQHYAAFARKTAGSGGSASLAAP